LKAVVTKSAAVTQLVRGVDIWIIRRVLCDQQSATTVRIIEKDRKDTVEIFYLIYSVLQSSCSFVVFLSFDNPRRKLTNNLTTLDLQDFSLQEVTASQNIIILDIQEF